MWIFQALTDWNSFPRARMNFGRWPILRTTLYRKPLQAPDFGSRFDQLSLRICLCNFHAIFLSTFSVPWCKKAKMAKKSNQRPTRWWKKCGCGHVIAARARAATEEGAWRRRRRPQTAPKWRRQERSSDRRCRRCLLNHLRSCCWMRLILESYFSSEAAPISRRWP